MDLNALNLLVDIIETGNLSKAAARRGMGRAAVSHRLGQFEQALGQQLLRRTTRQVEPTELGWKLYRHGLSIRQELLAAQDSVDSLGQAPQGKVRLSVPSGFGQLAMTAWLTEFMQRHPGIALEVIFDNTVEDLLAGRIDCAVRVMSEPPTHLVARHLGPVHYLACATPAVAAATAAAGHPPTLEALLQQPLISSVLTAQKLRMAGLLPERGPEGAAVRLRLVSPNFYFLREALLQGLGVGLMPDYMVREAIAQGALQALPLSPGSLGFLSTAMFMLHLPTPYPPRAMAMLLDFLAEKVAGSGSLGGAD